MGLYDETIGTLLVGIFFNTFLYGLVTYQFAAYHRTKFNDPAAVRYMVLFLFILDTFHSGSAIYMAWYYTVTNYNNPAALAFVWPYIFTPAGAALAAVVTQMYLGFRIWRLTNNYILYVVVVLLAIPSFVFGLVCSIKAWIIDINVSELTRITPFRVAWLSLQVAGDTFITVTLVIVFSRSRTGFRKMDTALNRLIRGAIQTGLFAGIFAMSDLITSVVLPKTNLYAMFGLSIGRIYTNTLMDTLLSRRSLDTDDVANVSVEFDSAHWPPANSQAISTVRSNTGVQIEVLQSTVQEKCDFSSSGASDRIL